MTKMKMAMKMKMKMNMKMRMKVKVKMEMEMELKMKMKIRGSPAQPVFSAFFNAAHSLAQPLQFRRCAVPQAR